VTDWRLSRCQLFSSQIRFKIPLCLFPCNVTYIGLSSVLAWKYAPWNNLADRTVSALCIDSISEFSHCDESVSHAYQQLCCMSYRLHAKFTICRILMLQRFAAGSCHQMELKSKVVCSGFPIVDNGNLGNVPSSAVLCANCLRGFNCLHSLSHGMTTY
jgi:hypothetical protein